MTAAIDPADSATAIQEPQGRLTSARFLGLLLTQIFGAMNDNLIRWYAVALAQQKMSPGTALSLGTVALTIPFLFFTPAAGWMADRFSKKHVIVACKVLEIVIAALAIAAVFLGNVWLLFAVVALMGAQSALFGPAKFGSIPEILPTTLLSKGNGIMSLCTIIAVAVGTVGGFALFDLNKPTLGEATLPQLLPAALTFIGVAVAGTLTSLLMHAFPPADPRKPPAINPLTDAIPAIRLLAADKPLLRTALGVAFFYLLASLSQQNIDPFGESILGLSKTDVGILLAILVIGMGAGSVLAGYWSDGKVELGIVPLGAVGIVISSFLVFISGSLVDAAIPIKSQFAYWGSCVSLFLLGASAGLYDVPLESYLQYRSHPKQRGTILAGSYFISFSLIVASSGLFYLLHEVIGLSASLIFLLAGIATIPVAVYIIRLLPDLTFRFFLWLMTHTIYRLRVIGAENIPAQGGALIVPNHVSFMDGCLVTVSCSRLIRFIVYGAFTEMPILAPLAKIMKVIPIRAEAGPKDLIISLRTAREAVLNGELVCIFAEGGLTRTGQLQSFQRGMLKIVEGTDIPIIPAHLGGLWGSIFSFRDGKFFWKWPKSWINPVEIRYGTPLRGVKDVTQVRQAVERLSEETYSMTTQEALVPARRFIRNCKTNRKGDRIADSGGTRLDGGKTLAGALAFRRVMLRSVLSPDEKNVGLLVPPSVGGALANAAVALCGRTSVNLNYTLNQETLNYCIKKAKLKHVLTSKAFLEKKPFTIEGAEFVFLEDLKAQVTQFDKLMAALGAYVLPASVLDRLLGLTRIKADDRLTIVFTSGSTGEPKGVVLTQQNIGANIDAVDHLLQLNNQDGILGVLPFFHSFGFTACMWLPLCYGVRGIYHFNPLDAKTVGQLVQDHKATILMATPTFLRMYLRRCEKEQFATLDTIVVGAEKLPIDLAREFEAKFGVLPTEGYGTTELSPVAAVNVPDHRAGALVQQGTKLGTVGRPLPGVLAKVVNPDTGEDLGIGPEGLLLIKGANVMQGYLDEPEKTAKVLRDGWYNTGDLAKLDTDGFVTITGRQSRFSKIGGEMVPHIRIEEELMRICETPGKEEADLLLAVAAVPDTNRGERLVVLHRSLNKPPEQIVKELSTAGLPNLWIPDARSFFPVEKIPILGTGKLDLQGIKTLALEKCGKA